MYTLLASLCVCVHWGGVVTLDTIGDMCVRAVAFLVENIWTITKS